MKATVTQPVFVLDELARALPSRVSVRQAYAFLLIGQRLAAGKDTVISDLRESGIMDSQGKPVFDASIGRSYQLFMDEPSKDYPEPLGWITLKADPEDRRRKLVQLTDKGRAFLKRIGA